jgi:hypothetical protein
VWSLLGGPLVSESSLVSKHFVSPLNDMKIMSMQSSPDPTPVLRSETSFDHVINISSPTPSEQERDLLSSSNLPPSLGEVPFDWDGLVRYQIHPPMPFQVRDVLRYIVEKVTSASTLSSSTWKALGFPKLVSAICKLLTFHRNPAREPWHPP